ncbi:hypothetical protein M407DRAFT_243310 [Tulasnella calospora MUT 4182]|uniref:Uncharacterized protein n=1 Tax=Tulasnella calospora MUT 4182 TaxID=1051891 RepID=A0A0C3M1F2_9AGAM|nr:hypothetical protein M407DRAFT_243310 [Tulasnella calospora MUT 4182]
MVHSLLKSFVLYFAFVISAVVLAAPAHHHPTEAHAREMARRGNPLLSLPRAAAPISMKGSQRSWKERNAAGKRVTNAMRFAKGLPPLAPRKLYNGSRAGSAHQARSSSVPLPVSAITIFGTEGRGVGEPMGWLKATDWATYSLSADCTLVNAQFLSGALTNPSTGYTDVFPNIGFVVPEGNPNFGTESSNWAIMSPTVATPNGSPPVSSPDQGVTWGSDSFMESNIWSLGADEELTLTWINPDGEAVPMEIGYFPYWGDGIVITGSISALSTYTVNNGAGEVVQIRLYTGGRGCQR